MCGFSNHDVASDMRTRMSNNARVHTRLLVQYMFSSRTINMDAPLFLTWTQLVVAAVSITAQAHGS